MNDGSKIRMHTTTGVALTGVVRTAYELGVEAALQGGTVEGATRAWRDFSNALKSCATDETLNAATTAYCDGITDGPDEVAAWGAEIENALAGVA